MGLRVARTRVLIYVISGALAGVAAVVYTAEVGGKAQNVTGIGWELDAIAAVVIGGTLLTGGWATCSAPSSDRSCWRRCG
jgi:simple sugar transport system permease protein